MSDTFPSNERAVFSHGDVFSSPAIVGDPREDAKDGDPAYLVVRVPSARQGGGDFELATLDGAEQSFTLGQTDLPFRSEVHELVSLALDFSRKSPGEVQATIAYLRGVLADIRAAVGLGLALNYDPDTRIVSASQNFTRGLFRSVTYHFIKMGAVQALLRDFDLLSLGLVSVDECYVGDKGIAYFDPSVINAQVNTSHVVKINTMLKQQGMGSNVEQQKGRKVVDGVAAPSFSRDFMAWFRGKRRGPKSFSSFTDVHELVMAIRGSMTVPDET